MRLEMFFEVLQIEGRTKERQGLKPPQLSRITNTNRVLLLQRREAKPLKSCTNFTGPE